MAKDVAEETWESEQPDSPRLVLNRWLGALWKGGISRKQSRRWNFLSPALSRSGRISGLGV